MKRFLQEILLCCILMSVGLQTWTLSNDVYASPFEFIGTGELLRVSPEFRNLGNIGDPVTIRIVADPFFTGAIISSDPTAVRAFYRNGISHMTLTTGTLSNPIYKGEYTRSNLTITHGTRFGIDGFSINGSVPSPNNPPLGGVNFFTPGIQSFAPSGPLGDVSFGETTIFDLASSPSARTLGTIGFSTIGSPSAFFNLTSFSNDPANTPIPEPSTGLLWGAGLFGLAYLRYKGKKRDQTCL